MRAREYPTLVEAVESGIRFGWQRLWKHRNDGLDIDVEDVVAAMEPEITSSICDRFTLDK